MQKVGRKEKRLEKLSKSTEKFKGKEYIYALGKRKTSRAQVRLYANGNGEFFVNGEKYDTYFKVLELQTIMVAPLTLIGSKTKFDACVYASGGGIRGQAEAVCHGIAQALETHEAGHRIALKKSGLLTRDPRIVERKKPGKKKARKGPTWSKR